MTRPVATALLALCLLAGPAATTAAAQSTGPRSGTAGALERAREESSVRARPRGSAGFAAGLVRLSDPELLASGQGALEIAAELERAVPAGTLELDLPGLWTQRAPGSDLRYTRLPAAGDGTGDRAGVRREGDRLRFRFNGARAGDLARFRVQDLGLPAGTYRLPFRWREAGGRPDDGTLTVVVYAPSREREEGEAPLSRLADPGEEENATDDAANESETFVTVVPGNRKRFVLGANGGGGYSAWVTDDGGQTFAKATMPATTDAPRTDTDENAQLCCDPMSAADSSGTIWYGGLSQATADAPSRIVVNRIAAGQTQFTPRTTGLPARTAGVQDKPMMTIDDVPASPRRGRLYVVWNEPDAGGGINLVVSQCDTRVGGVPARTRCDDADNWSTPVNVRAGAGSVIYADVATASDGTVYVVWWDFSAANAIVGTRCGPAAPCTTAGGWAAPSTVATLDATGGTPVPFACPILAQPGGRAAPSPQLDVDHSGGPRDGRVYVTWSDLRPGSGSTKCNAAAPQSTHLSWDSFVASADDVLPGGASPSAAVATRLMTDGEGGGQTPSDDWFPWLAVDQTTGQAWADLYSTRDDATRRTTHFYVRSVTPGGPAGHSLGALKRVSSTPSDFSGATCCTFGNDFGDYTGIDATQGVAIPVWTDRRAGGDGEVFTFVAIEPSLKAGDVVVQDTGGDGDGALEPGEPFTLTQPLRNAGRAKATGVQGTLAPVDPAAAVGQASSAYPEIAVAGTAANATPYTGTLGAAAACGDDVALSLRVATAQGPFTVPVSVPTGAAKPVQAFVVNPSALIPDADPTGLTSPLTVAGVGRLRDLDVTLFVDHPYDGDLEVRLTAPDGTVVPLVLQRGGAGDNFLSTIFDDEATESIAEGTPPFSERFRPEAPLSVLDGRTADGTWTLSVVDVGGGDVGTLQGWGLRATGIACSPPPAAPALTATDPASGALDTTPRIRGTAPAGATVRLFTTATCTGTPAASGSAATLASPGLEVAVPPGATTQVRGTATVGGLTSLCSAPLAYAAAGPPPPTTTTEPPPTTGTTEPPGTTTQLGPGGGGVPTTPTPPSGGVLGSGGAGTPTATPIGLALSTAARQRPLKTRGIVVGVSCAVGPCAVVAKATIALKPTARTTTVRKTLAAGARARLVLRLPAKVRRRLATRLRRGSVRATITVTATDAKRTRQTSRKTVRLTR